MTLLTAMRVRVLVFPRFPLLRKDGAVADIVRAPTPHLPLAIVASPL